MNAICWFCGKRIAPSHASYAIRGQAHGTFAAHAKCYQDEGYRFWFTLTDGNLYRQNASGMLDIAETLPRYRIGK